MKKIISVLRECAQWGALLFLSAFMFGIFALLLGTWSLADGGTDGCAKMAAFVLKNCGSLFYK